MRLKKNAAPFDQPQPQSQQFVGQTQPNRQKRAVWFSFFVCFSQTNETCIQQVLSVYITGTYISPYPYNNPYGTMGVRQEHKPRHQLKGEYISSHHLFTNCLLLRPGYRFIPWVTIRYRLGYHGLPCRVTVGYRPVYQIHQIYQNRTFRYTKFIGPV